MKTIITQSVTRCVAVSVCLVAFATPATGQGWGLGSRAPVLTIAVESDVDGTPDSDLLRMVPFTLREWLDPADDAVPLACEGEGDLQVDRNLWTGSAIVTHLGRSVVDLRIESCTTERVPVGEEIHLWTANFTALYTAANGDELWAEGVLRSYDPQRIESDLTITGGTGRFAGATGWATGAGFRASDAYVAYSEAHGVVSRPNSSR
jgi:hypothetical protein